MNQSVVQNNRVAIIIPPIQDFYATPHRLSALGINIVAWIVREAGFSTLFIDGTRARNNNRSLPLPKALSYLKPHIIPNETGKCSFFTRFRHFGRTSEEIVQETADFNPGLCLIGSFAFCYSGPIIELASRIKMRCTQTIIVAGGAGVTVYPDYFLRNDSIDYTLCGEAEAALPLFLEFIRNRELSPGQIPFLGWKQGAKRLYSVINTVTTTATLTPIIQKTDVDDRRTPYTASLSRGCPSACRFCSNHLAHGREFRHCSIERFEEELANLPRVTADHEIRINFEDDNLLCNLPFFRDVLDRCRAAFPRVAFTAENGLDYRLMSPAQCEELITAGFVQFNFTIGSTAPAVLDHAGRVLDMQHYDSLLSVAAQHGIPVVSYIICGFPEDTKASVADNLLFLAVRRTVLGMSLFYPVPGITGFEDRTRFDDISPQCCAGASAYPWGGILDTTTLITAFRLARLINLLKASGHSDEERTLIQRTLTTERLHTIIKKGGKRSLIEVPVQDAELAAMVLKNLPQKLITD